MLESREFHPFESRFDTFGSLGISIKILTHRRWPIVYQQRQHGRFLFENSDYSGRELLDTCIINQNDKVF